MPQELAYEIIEAVANSEGVEPTELDFVLADYVDVDALNQLVEHGNSRWTLKFELPEHSVTVTSDRAILVESESERTSISS